MIVADTDVLIDFLAGVASSFERVRAELERGALSTTAITRFELLWGAATPKQEARILDLLAGDPALPLDSAAADSAATSASNLLLVSPKYSPQSVGRWRDSSHRDHRHGW